MAFGRNTAKYGEIRQVRIGCLGSRVAIYEAYLMLQYV